MSMGQGRKVLLGILFVILILLAGTAGFVLLAGGGLAAGTGSWNVEKKSAAEAGPGRANADGNGSNGEDASEIGSFAAETEVSAEESPVRVELRTEAEDGGKHAAGIGSEAEEGQSDPEMENCILLFAGDVYLSNHVLNSYDKAGGIHGVLDDGIRAEIKAADIFMVNQEFPFTDRGTAAEDKQFTFRLPPERVRMFTEMGIDIVTLANNHILDFGPEGITDSIAALDGAGILHVGAGENLEQAKKLEIIETCGRKIGFLGVSRVYMAASWAAGASHPGVFSTYDPTMALEAIREAREQVDYLVVYVHWGVERETEPLEYQRTMGRQYIDAGADLVIGSHPHVLQPVEYYNDKPIAYSLGNFVFGSSIPGTELLKVELKDDEVEVTEIPCTSSAGYTRLK